VGLNHGKGYLSLIRDHERAELAAVCDVNPEILKAAADGARTFASYDRLLEWGQFDAVVIATPPFTHKALCLQAVEAGKHVLVEKPMTMDLGEAEALAAGCRNARTVCQVGFCVRSSQLISKLREVIRSGRIGDVVFVWWHMFLRHTPKSAWREDRKLGGGKLIDCGCHYMDILRVLAGASFHRLTAYGTQKGAVGPDAVNIPRIATVIFEFENGAKANLTISEVSPTPENSLFGVVGSNGIVYGNPWRPEGAGSLDCYTDGCLYREQIVINGAMASRGHLGFHEQFNGFLDAIDHGSPVPCTIEDGLEVVRMTTAIDRSMATGETVHRKDLAEGNPGH
jgi:predicted dehydrogenase